MSKTNLSRNLITEQAIDELALKNFIKKPAKSNTLFKLPELNAVPTGSVNRTTLLKMIGWNCIILLLFFVAVAIFFEEHIRAAQLDFTHIAKTSSMTDALKSMTNSTTTGVVDSDEHVPISVLVQELTYYVSTATTVAFSFVIRKIMVALKVFLTLSLWIVIKSFVLFSLVLEYTGFGVKWFIMNVAGIIFNVARALWTANVELAEFFTAIAGLLYV